LASAFGEWLIQRMEPIAVRAQRALKRGSGTGEILCLHDGGHRSRRPTGHARWRRSSIGCRAGVTWASNLLNK